MHLIQEQAQHIPRNPPHSRSSIERPGPPSSSLCPLLPPGLRILRHVRNGTQTRQKREEKETRAKGVYARQCPETVPAQDAIDICLYGLPVLDPT